MKRKKKSQSGLKRKSAQQQLFELVGDIERDNLRDALQHLAPEAKEELCCSWIAYLRFGIERSFLSPFLDVVFYYFVGLFEAEKSKSNNNHLFIQRLEERI